MFVRNGHAVGSLLVRDLTASGKPRKRAAARQASEHPAAPAPATDDTPTDTDSE